MSIYDTPIPANVEIYVSEFRKMIKFEILKPDNLLGIVQPGLTLADLMNLSKPKLSGGMESSGIESASPVVNMAIYIFAGAFFLLAILIILILKNLEKFKAKLTKILSDVKRKTFWNNTIRSITISYLETAISLNVMHQSLRSGGETSVPTYAGMYLYLLIYPIICARTIYKYHSKISEK